MAKMFGILTLLTLAVGLVAGVAGAADVKTGLVGYWPMDGNANDLSGNGHDGVLMENPDFVAGKRGQAVQLVGPVGGDAQRAAGHGIRVEGAQILDAAADEIRVGYTDVDRAVGTREMPRELTRIFQRFPCKLQQQALLRIHLGSFTGRNAEELCVESIDAVD